MKGKICKYCGDIYTPEPEEGTDSKLCQECFDMLESSSFPEDDIPSDADPGL